MIKGLSITPPVIGRISIGRIVEKDGKRRPEKDDQFTLTTQIQTRQGWVTHPLDGQLRADAPGGKLRSLPVRLLFNDPDLNLRADYTRFDRNTGRPLCVGDGETCRRRTEDGVQSLPCPGPEACPLAGEGACKPYARLSVRIGDDDDVGVFLFRTTSYNSIRTLTARLHYYHALSGGHLATLPLCLKLRGKSTRQSHGTAIYYVDLTLREEQPLDVALVEARDLAETLAARGFDQAALDAAARAGLANGAFEYSEDEGLEVVEEFPPDASGSEPHKSGPKSGEVPPSGLRQKLGLAHPSDANPASPSRPGGPGVA
ncbi:hydrolase or metal-binding protein [Alcanivorax sp. 24]|uniref:recombination directionality factor n=1 Tax=Alcanivorax sp. 24 TaxID=2545266 RepID=UPI001060A8B0|nr:hydrolase or metal-binding protein [Alcanivorax sp. 24]